jgi:hypothetical protein
MPRCCRHLDLQCPRQPLLPPLLLLLPCLPFRAARHCWRLLLLAARLLPQLLL